jgi:hypothetical protein
MIRVSRCLSLACLLTLSSLLACTSSDSKYSLLEVRRASERNIPGECELLLNGGIYVGPKAIVTEADLLGVRFSKDTVGTTLLDTQWSKEAQRQLASAFEGGGYLVAYLINGRVVSSSLLDDPSFWSGVFIQLTNPLAEGEREALEALGKKLQENG